MPTNTQPYSRFATMDSAQVLAELVAMAERHAVEDAERRARWAARLAELGVG